MQTERLLRKLTIIHERDDGGLNLCDEQLENKIQRKIPFETASKRIKYFKINLTKEVQILCSENYKILLKKLNKI